MKVVFLADDFPPQSFGGAGISTYELAKGMQKAGHEVHVITTCRNESEAGEADYNGLKVFKIASNYHERWRAYIGLHNPFAIREIRKILEKIRPNVVHVNNVHYYLSFYSIKLAKKYAKVVVFTARDAMSVTYGKLRTKKYLEHFDCDITWFDQLKQAKKRWNPFKGFFIKKYLKYADQIFAVSEALKIALEKNGIKNVSVIRTGFNVDIWNSNEDEKNEFREKYNLRNKKVILFAGRLSEFKGGWKAIEAIAETSNLEPDVVLLAIGKVDSHAQAMRSYAEKLKISDKVIFTGWVERDEGRVAYSVADVVLVPSLFLDPFPRNVLEAMAAGKPVIGSCYGGSKEIIEDGVTGYVVNPNDIKGMTSRILELLGDPIKSERFGENGRERIKNQLNFNKYIEKYVSCYRELLSKNTK